MTAPAVVGSEWSVRRTITQADLDGFAAVSGDDNPIHVDADYAATTPFRRPVAHGMFLFALVRAQVRKHWPDARCTEQRLRFSAPTPAGSTVTIRLRVVGRDDDGLRLGTTVTGPDGSLGLEGECRLEFGRDGAS
ncbi:MAG TPA: MaoC/PaaZ C-terminal domain-containing protein [Jiangellaceae bacterium]|nr:MaoC/PaaZ C-terminal domain-containing protein [Jiangellaceae bacterium]